jgi:hypothetical protein
MKILNGIHVVEPANWRKAERVRNLPGLREQLDVEAGDGLAQAIRCGPERGKAAALPGMQFVLEFGKSGSLQNSGEGLDKAVHRRDGDGVAGYARVMEQVRDKRGREQREDRRAVRRRSERKCRPWRCRFPTKGQGRALSHRRPAHTRREMCERTKRLLRLRLEVRLRARLKQRARSAAHRQRAIGPCRGPCGWIGRRREQNRRHQVLPYRLHALSSCAQRTASIAWSFLVPSFPRSLVPSVPWSLAPLLPASPQPPSSSRKRMSDSMPSEKFFRLNFSLGAWRLSSGRPKPIMTLGRPR